MKVNPIKWAAIGCLGCATTAVAASLSGNPMPSTIAEAGLAGLFWGWVAALVRNRGLR